MVTHGHGQGYADLHFLIPETVEHFDVYKGPYFARFGDFGTAGSVSFQTKDHPDKNLVKLEGGMFNTGKLTTVLKIPTNSAHQSAYMAGQFYTTDGPFDSPQDFKRFNIFGKFHSHLTENSVLSLSLGAFSSGWNASGQIPTRAVNEGIISRFGAIDNMEGGTTSRENVSVEYVYGEGTDHEFKIQGYLCWYDFRLFSNFTFWLKDSVDGDMIEQTDKRNIPGINTHYVYRRPWGTVLTKTTVGGGVRADNIEVGLWNSPDRIRKTLRTNDGISQRNLFLWIEEDLIFNTRWRLQLGLRGDYFTFNVNDKLDLPDQPVYVADDLPRASTYYHQAIVNPKLNMVYSPSESVEIFLNSGSGFHSNDARDVTIAQRVREIQYGMSRRGYTDSQIDSTLVARNFDPGQKNILTLPRALGFEVGTKLNLGENVILSMAAWYLHMQEELVFIGDEGTTEISGETRRIGLDLEGRMQLTPWLWADVDLNMADGKYIHEPEGNNKIPLAPRLTSTGGLTAILKTGFEGALRYRFVGDRPANESNTIRAEGYFVTNLMLAYRFGIVKVFGSIENLLNSKWNEAQFDTESRLFWEKQPVSEIHFTPGNPFNVQFGISVEF
jgi:outer membrane receptor protein involved in Fe transport